MIGGIDPGLSGALFFLDPDAPGAGEAFAMRRLVGPAPVDAWPGSPLRSGVLNGPRAYCHDPDGTVLEFIDLTNYSPVRAGGRPI